MITKRFPSLRIGSHAKSKLTIFTELTIETMNSVCPLILTQKGGSAMTLHCTENLHSCKARTRAVNRAVCPADHQGPRGVKYAFRVSLVALGASLSGPRQSRKDKQKFDKLKHIPVGDCTLLMTFLQHQNDKVNSKKLNYLPKHLQNLVERLFFPNLRVICIIQSLDAIGKTGRNWYHSINKILIEPTLHMTVIILYFTISIVLQTVSSIAHPHAFV